MNVRPELDVRELRLTDAAQALECIVLEKLASVLDIRAQQMSLPRARPQLVSSALEKVLTRKIQALLQLLALHDEHGLSNARLRKDWCARSKSVLGSFQPEELTKTTHTGILNAVLRAKRANEPDFLGDDARGVSILPEHVWQYLRTLAFDTSKYKERSCRLLRDHVLNRYYVSPKEPPLPTLHPNTSFLLLLAVPHHPRHAAHLKIYEPMIREITQSLVLTEAWASFWDQWLLAETLLAFPRSQRLTSRLSASVYSLPYISQISSAGGASIQEPTATTTTVLACSTWENNKPSWIPAGSGDNKGSDVRRSDNQAGG